MTASQVGETIQIVGLLLQAAVFFKILRDGRFRDLGVRKPEDLSTWFDTLFSTTTLKVLFVTGFALTLLGGAIMAWQ